MKTVITGAAAGLGHALAVLAAERGDEVIAVDLDDTGLKRLDCETLTLDLTAEDASERLARSAGKEIGMIIHSAGISGTGPFEAIPPERHAAIMALNFATPIRITTTLLASDAMAERSMHAFVGSLSSFTGYPGAVSYAASKDGLASFARSLNAALPKGQNATCIYPGPLATDHAARYAPDNRAKTVAARQKPKDAARRILADLARGKRQIFPSGKAQLLARMGQLAPTATTRLLKRALYDKLPEPKL